MLEFYYFFGFVLICIGCAEAYAGCSDPYEDDVQHNILDLELQPMIDRRQSMPIENPDEVEIELSEQEEYQMV